MNNTRSDSEQSATGAPIDYSESQSSSSSSAASSTTSCTSDDSEDNQLDTIELATILKETLRLPRGLCENAKIFCEFFSAETWNLLPIPIRERLQQLLPHFTNLVTPQEEAFERQRTLIMLFNGDLKRFGHTPLTDLQRELEDGNYRPDVLKLRQSIAKSRRREQRFQKCERISQFAKDLFLSRERLLRKAYKSAPDTILRTERNTKRQQNTLHVDTKLCTVRSRKRYHKELKNITEQLGVKAGDLSEDEEECTADDVIIDDFNRNSKSDISPFSKTPTIATDRFIYSTFFKRRHELTDEDAVRADQQSQQTRLSNRNFRSFMLEHKRRKLKEPTLPDFETSDIRLRDVCARAQMGSNFKQLFGTGRNLGKKPKSKILSVATNATEPPALVPIHIDGHNTGTHRNMANEPLEATPATEHSPINVKVKQNAQHYQQPQQLMPPEHAASTSIQHPFLPEDGAPFNILDGEVELQQEEVETYGSCEETLQRFVINNEVDLPTIEQSDLPPQKLLQTPHKQDNCGNINLKSKLKAIDNVVAEHKDIPKLEPLSHKPNRSAIKEKIRAIPQTTNSTNLSNHSPATAAAIVTPIKRQPTTQSFTNSTISYSPGNHAISSDLIQETHACFFSLIRDLFCATTHHRMQYNELSSRIDIWLRNPITALNDWYAQAESWPALLMSAINFLAGDFSNQPDEYVPYIEFKQQQNIFQWIGAGRDSDTRLSTLCNYWLQRRHDMTSVKKHTQALVGKSTTEVTNSKSTPNGSEKGISAATTTTPITRRNSMADMEEVAISYDGGVSPPPPPPPRCPTTWTVCAATNEEVNEFQRQERERFEQPHRAYTYRMHGYESVVGPVKGIYTQMYALTKARGHSMMVVNRPNFVTILTLVRDATARLPNGEGTRADIAELLKSSQYINLKEGENVLQTTVSGALDRMHTEHDPCVRYDPKRKIWIYLHRNRSECDFERIHQQQQGLGKTKKAGHRKSKVKIGVPPPPLKGTKGTTEVVDNNNISIITAGNGTNVEGVVNVAAPGQQTPKVSTAFSLPALVPANPIIVSSSQGAITQQQQQNKLSITSITTKPALNRSLPVPPLKYNIPPPHQQQKSLLKSTIQSLAQRQQQQQQQQLQQMNNNIGICDTQSQHNQRIQQQRIMTLTKNVATANELVVEENKANKQINLIVSPSKTLNTGGGSNSTPIIVATPSGLQTVHVSNATVVTPSKFSSPGTGTIAASQQSSPPQLSATLGGKKVSINKPIVINQVRGQSNITTANKNKAPSSPQILKQSNAALNAQQTHKQQQSHSFMIPISMANSLTKSGTGIESQDILVRDTNLRSVSVSSSVSNNNIDATTAIYMDSTQFITNVDNATQQEQSPQQQPKQTLAKNIIRLVPSIGSGGVKSILQSTSTSGGGIASSNKQPVHVIGHRVVASSGSGGSGGVVTAVRSQTQQNKSVENISKINASNAQTSVGAVSSIITAASGSTLIKMSPHTFATLQQKQGQHIIVKQSSTSPATLSSPTNEQLRAIERTTFLKNTSIVAQPGSGQTTQTIGKKVVMQQPPTTAVMQKTSVASQTFGTAPAQSGGKVNTINTTSLTTQQQRILLQNIKQQQQQQNVQFKTVQVLSSAGNNSQIQNQQIEQSQIQHQVVSRAQTLTMLPTHISAGGATVGQQGNNKAMTVIVSQPQGTSRIFKTVTTQSQQQQQQSITITANDSTTAATSTGGTRILTTSTGQIISLESLLQKQNISGSGSLKISPSNSNIGTIVKNLQNASVINQQQQKQPQIVASGGGNTTTYTVVSQARNTTNTNTTTKNTFVSGTAGGAASGGRIFVSTGGGQLTATQLAKVVGKTAGGSTSAGSANIGGGNIRVIKNATSVGSSSFNIGNLQSKQVVFATKPAATVTKSVGNVVQSQQIQTTGMVIGGKTVKLQKNTQQQQQQQQQKTINSSLNNNSGNQTFGVLAAQSGTQMQTVLMGNQILRVQQMPTTVKNTTSSSGSTLPFGSFVTTTPASSNSLIVNTNNSESGNTTTINLPKTVVLGSGGQAVRLQQTQPQISTQKPQLQAQTQMVTVKNAVQQATKTSNVGRVVLAVQGGGQIFLSPNFQGNTLNMKSLQNMKVVSLTPRSGTPAANNTVQQQAHDKSLPASQQQKQYSSGSSSNS
ncbi:nuclear factor related to kappa-B-binding protein [Eurosta solidaginis]|uniref:nuclear factor related to kappa-B-binding protein n=1 Tax=Eurosta solidaginis TaxID=178769 RepID=UPI0035309291